MNITFNSLLRHNIIVLSTSSLLLLQRVINYRYLSINEEDDECIVINGDKKIIHISKTLNDSENGIRLLHVSDKMNRLLIDEDIRKVHGYLYSYYDSITTSIDHIITSGSSTLDIRLQENHIASNIYHVPRFYKGTRREWRHDNIIEIPIEFYVIDEHLIEVFNNDTVGVNDIIYGDRLFKASNDNVISIGGGNNIIRYVFNELAFKQ